ncbi:MAG: NFACT family protein [Campylobacteraceae bacterium]
MKYYELLLCTKFLNNFSFISLIKRVDDNVLKIVFDNKNPIYVDLKKGSSTLFICENFQNSKIYQAPFDVVLHKRFSSAKIQSIKTLENNRVLEIKVSQMGSYKKTDSTLLLEFTGRNTNAIILDEEDVVVEALRHIDKNTSYRFVKVGEKLEPLLGIKINEKQVEIKDVKEFLEEVYKNRQNANLQNLKTQKRFALHKKIEKFQELLTNLDDEKELLKNAEKSHKMAVVLLSNKYALNDYDKEFTLTNLDGSEISYKLDKDIKTLQEAINGYFEKSKKLKKKHII